MLHTENIFTVLLHGAELFEAAASEAHLRVGRTEDGSVITKVTDAAPIDSERLPQVGLEHKAANLQVGQERVRAGLRIG